MRAGGYFRLSSSENDRFTRVNFNGQRFEAVQTYGDGQGDRVFERDTQTCCHCNVAFLVPPHPDPDAIGMCRNCMKPLCRRCSSLPCRPFERALEQDEARNAALRSYGL